jgi:hypothetical protein
MQCVWQHPTLFVRLPVSGFVPAWRGGSGRAGGLGRGTSRWHRVLLYCCVHGVVFRPLRYQECFSSNHMPCLLAGRGQQHSRVLQYRRSKTAAQCRYGVADAGVAVSHVLNCGGGPGFPWSSVCTTGPSTGVCVADITWVVFSLAQQRVPVSYGDMRGAIRRYRRLYAPCKFSLSLSHTPTERRSVHVQCTPAI